MKSNFNLSAAAVPTLPAPPSRSRRPVLSIRKGSQHVLVNPLSGPVVRVPALAQNRVYLKALRQAEMAAWEAAKPATKPVAKAAPAPRLPLPERGAVETRLYTLLLALSVTTLGYQLQSLLQSAGGWRDFVQFVQRFLT